jgi:phosphomannomutase
MAISIQIDGTKIPERIFRRYDIRGIYLQDITTQTVGALARVIAQEIAKKRPLVIAYDGRTHSPMLARAAVRALPSARVIFVGRATTPMFYFLVHHLRAAGGIMITASHNPKQYTGMKVVCAHAEPVDGAELEKIVARYSRRP